MREEIEARVKAFRQALELAARERAGEPILSGWRQLLKSFPSGCCELASQTLVQYLRDHDKKLFPYIIAMQWIDNNHMRGHVIVALDGEYTDLTLDQFDEYDDWIMAEPIESGGQLGSFLKTVRNLKGSFTTRELTLDVIPGDGHKLYGWLKDTADSLLSVPEQIIRLPPLLSMEIPSEYRDRTYTNPSYQAGHAPEKKNQKAMTHVGTISECYKPRQSRLRETKTMWISESGLRFRKSTGAAVGSSVWSSHRLDLKSIREIQPDN